jgi:hypothetical protein
MKNCQVLQSTLQPKFKKTPDIRFKHYLNRLREFAILPPPDQGCCLVVDWSQRKNKTAISVEHQNSSDHFSDESMS